MARRPDAKAADEVREALRAAILRGVYVPRQRLIESELADYFQTSRFVVRNALLQLASDALVEIQPNRGARVREISVAEAIEITEVRRALEGLVAARAAERVTDAEITDLNEIGEAMQLAVKRLEPMHYSALNVTLHSRLREIADHRTAMRVIDQLNGQMVRHQFTLSLVPGRPHVSLPEHLQIIRAVCSRDPEAAEQAMRQHISSVVRALTAFRDTSPDALALSVGRQGAE
jgi:DNA-binding GntR family transcriptional regulator